MSPFVYSNAPRNLWQMMLRDETKNFIDLYDEGSLTFLRFHTGLYRSISGLKVDSVAMKKIDYDAKII